MYSPINITSITLVPKITNASKPKDFRPISCCSVLYKINAKILTAILQIVVAHRVDPAQSGFIPGRQICDNILLATDFIRGYNWANASPRCMLRVDMAKAYDSVEWPFLKCVMQEMSFPSQFINWVMNCVATVSYSILINGFPSIPFRAQKGLRQGDPMSPFLFAFSMKYFSRCLKKKKSDIIKFDPKCNCSEVMKLLFADDLLVFLKADLPSMHALNLVLDDLYMVSGLSVNKGKSALYVAGVEDAMSFKLVQASQIPKGVLPFRYLGVPLSAKRLGIQDCLVLVEKITSRINHWAARNLSLLDRLHLVRSVIQSMHSYWGQIFILPAKIVQMVKAMCNKFLWSSGRDSKAKSHVAWSHVCLPKSCGGLNLSRLDL